MSEEASQSLLTPQQELFCLKYIECKRNASEAYRQSYNCKRSSKNTVSTEAYKLLRNPYISHRLRQLFDIQAERLNVTTESAAAEYEEIRILARNSGDYSPAVSAITGKAKLFGLITDKSISSVTIEEKREKTETELKEELMARGLPVDSIFAK